jgi:hypothetical protein
VTLRFGGGGARLSPQRDAYAIASVTLRLPWYDKVALAFETTKAAEREALEN